MHGSISSRQTREKFCKFLIFNNERRAIVLLQFSLSIKFLDYSSKTLSISNLTLVIDSTESFSAIKKPKTVHFKSSSLNSWDYRHEHECIKSVLLNAAKNTREQGTTMDLSAIRIRARAAYLSSVIASVIGPLLLISLYLLINLLPYVLCGPLLLKSLYFLMNLLPCVLCGV